MIICSLINVSVFWFQTCCLLCFQFSRSRSFWCTSLQLESQHGNQVGILFNYWCKLAKAQLIPPSLFWTVNKDTADHSINDLYWMYLVTSVTTEMSIKKMFPQTDIRGISVTPRFTENTNNPAPRIKMPGFLQLPEMYKEKTAGLNLLPEILKSWHSAIRQSCKYVSLSCQIVRMKTFRLSYCYKTNPSYM